MFKFLFGVAFGAAGYWAWQSFGRDLLGMGGDQESTYGGFNASTSSTSPSITSTSPTSPSTTSTTTPTSTPSSSSTTTGGAV
jgi:hypothetical protein